MLDILMNYKCSEKHFGSHPIEASTPGTKTLSESLCHIGVYFTTRFVRKRLLGANSAKIGRKLLMFKEEGRRKKEEGRIFVASLSLCAFALNSFLGVVHF